MSLTSFNRYIFRTSIPEGVDHSSLGKGCSEAPSPLRDFYFSWLDFFLSSQCLTACTYTLYPYTEALAKCFLDICFSIWGLHYLALSMVTTSKCLQMSLTFRLLLSPPPITLMQMSGRAGSLSAHCWHFSFPQQSTDGQPHDNQGLTENTGLVEVGS